MNYDKATLDYYEDAAPRYRFSTALDHHRHLDPFLDRLNAGAKILELGCGTGSDAAHMIERGFIVDATDGTAAMVRKANERYDVAARQMRFDELEEHNAYDAVWAHACLLHLPRADLPNALSRIHTALKPGGLHFANFKLGDPDHPDEGRDPLGRWTSLPTPDWLEKCYVKAHFSIVERQTYRGNGSDGVVRDWLAITVKRT
ncbi:MAG: class I SAM-dependent methyltransferase [Pseudomonadota bacterium]